MRGNAFLRRQQCKKAAEPLHGEVRSEIYSRFAAQKLFFFFSQRNVPQDWHLYLRIPWSQCFCLCEFVLLRKVFLFCQAARHLHHLRPTWSDKNGGSRAPIINSALHSYAKWDLQLEDYQDHAYFVGSGCTLVEIEGSALVVSIHLTTSFGGPKRLRFTSSSLRVTRTRHSDNRGKVFLLRNLRFVMCWWFWTVSNSGLGKFDESSVWSTALFPKIPCTALLSIFVLINREMCPDCLFLCS